MDYLSSSLAESRTGLGDLMASNSNFGLEDFGDGPGHNKSFQSVLSATSVATGNASSSSKAVLAALRALQDKIRRLETERSQALDEVTQLRMQLKNQEIEAEHQKQRDQLTSQRSLQETKVAQERIQQEKVELEVKVQRMEEKIRISQQTSEDLVTKVRVLEEEKHSNQLKLREVENTHHQMEQQIKSLQVKEKDMAQALIWETKHHEEEVSMMNNRVMGLQEELAKISHEKGALDAKLLELDQLVGQLLSLNESLVAQLSGRPWKAIVPKKTVKKSTKKAAAVAVPRAATLSTVSSELAKAPKSAIKKNGVTNFDDVEQLKALHKAYAKMASSLTRSLSPRRSPTKARPSSANQSLASLGTSNGSTRIGSRKKKSSNSTTATSSSYHEGSNSQYNSRTSTPQPSSVREFRLPKPAVSFDQSQVEDEQAEPMNHSQSYLSHHQMELSHLASSNQAQHHNHRSGYQTQSSSSHELHSMIGTLEDEFNDLNRQYRRLLSNVSAGSGSEVPESLSEQSIDTRAQEIVQVIQKLHEKGEQLRVLKSPTKL